MTRYESLWFNRSARKLKKKKKYERKIRKFSTRHETNTIMRLKVNSQCIIKKYLITCVINVLKQLSECVYLSTSVYFPKDIYFYLWVSFKMYAYKRKNGGRTMIDAINKKKKKTS